MVVNSRDSLNLGKGLLSSSRSLTPVEGAAASIIIMHYGAWSKLLSFISHVGGGSVHLVGETKIKQDVFCFMCFCCNPSRQAVYLQIPVIFHTKLDN